MTMTAPGSNSAISRKPQLSEGLQNSIIKSIDKSIDTVNLPTYPSELTHQVTDTLQRSLLEAALDRFFDGILVVDTDGEIIQSNRPLQRFFPNGLPFSLTMMADHRCNRQQKLPISSSAQPLLTEIWRVCEAVIDSREMFPREDIVLDSEVAVDGTSFRIRVRWMDLVLQGKACLLITIEDLDATLVNQVTVDRWKYRLTPREAEVWELKRRGYSYQNIAATLYIAENTVKKHLKNIQAKRRNADVSSRSQRFA